MNFLQILILAIIQGACELLPVSSSAHVIVAEKLMGLDPTSPPMTMMLVALHTGTMFAVIVYFWKTWRATYFSSVAAFKTIVGQVIIATILTGIVGVVLQKIIEKIFLRHHGDKAEIEMIFGNLSLIAISLFVVGLLIIFAGAFAKRRNENGSLTASKSAWIGAVQGLCLPFRGFSRSGATISAALILGVSKMRAEAFSFALAVVLTPAVIAREFWRLKKDHHIGAALHQGSLSHTLALDGIGMIFSFLAGLLALVWLSKWLEKGRWQYFGIYCLVAAVVVFGFYLKGF